MFLSYSEDKDQGPMPRTTTHVEHMAAPSPKKRKLEDSEPSSSTRNTETDGPEMAASKIRTVLVLCGSMSPITNLHLRMFELARDCLNHTGKYVVDKGIISIVHDKYGKKGLAPSFHRLAMCKLALQGSDWITLDPWECQQDMWTPTRQVMEHLQDMVSKEVDTNAKIKLLCGADLLESFATPDLWAEEDIDTIVGKFGLVVISRAGHNAERFIYESDHLSPLKNNIHIATEWIPNDVSSTKIRRSLRRGESVKYLIPDTVIDYIREHGLYQNSEASSS